MAVVIPAYNRARLLPRALDSVAAQEVLPAEVIVVDDGSSDESAAVAAEFGARVIRHATNRGPAAARNTGFFATQQPWLAQLDSDDEWLPDCLRTLWALRERHVLVCGASVTIDPAGKIGYNGAGGSEPRVLASPGELVFPDNFVAASGVLLRASCVRAVGGYREDLRYAEDLELWLRMLEVGTGLATPEPVVRYRVHPGQATESQVAVRDGHRHVINMSIDRAWWREYLAVRWSAGPVWDDARRALRQRDWAALRTAARLLVSDPQRAYGVIAVLRHRRRARRKAASYAADLSERAEVNRPRRPRVLVPAVRE